MKHLPYRTHLLVAIEFAAGLASLVLAALWVQDPSGPYEPYLAATGLLFLGTELFRRYEGKLFKTEGVERTPAERVQHHETLRKIFREEIDRCRAQHLRKDVVIRHVNRMDDYPNTTSRAGISPWFKVGLLDTYHAGIKVGLQWDGLIQTTTGLRKPNHKKNEQKTETLMLMGEIPFDFIETMNVDGDEYYYLPHIFCHFANNGEPYERLYYAEKVDMGHGHHYWKKVSPFRVVEQNTREHERNAA